MKSNSKEIYHSSGNMFILFIVFLVLKLTGTVDWSWWMITLPLWIGVAIVLFVLLIAIVIIGFGATFIGLRALLNKWGN